MPQIGHLDSLDLLLMLLYAVGVMGLGLWVSRSQTTTEEYFLAGRRINFLIAGISVVASLISTVSYLALPGEMIKKGPGWLFVVLHIPVSFIVVGYFVIPRIMARRVTTGYELLEAHFGRGIRQTTSVMFILSRIFWMGLVIYTCSFAVASVSGIPLRYILIGVGGIGTLYTVMGGIRAVLITDAVQFVILFGGALFTIALVTVHCGGFAGWWPDWTSPALQNLNWDRIKIFSLNPFDRLTVFSTALYAASFWICTSTSDQVVIQRFLCTKNERAARRMFGVSLIGDMLTILTMGLTGIALLGFFLRFPERLPDTGLMLTEQADKLFPYFIAEYLPTGVSGLVIAALLAAAMSSLDSGISSIGTVLMTDFSDTFARGCDSERAKLRRAKRICLVVGIVAIALSMVVPLIPGVNILEIAVRIGSIFVPPLFVVFALAFFVKFSTRSGAWTAIAFSLLCSLAMTYWQQIYTWIFGTASDFSIVLIMPLASLFGFVAGVIVSWFTRSNAQTQS